jgi:hypothetical protein
MKKSTKFSYTCNYFVNLHENVTYFCGGVSFQLGVFGFSGLLDVFGVFGFFGEKILTRRTGRPDQRNKGALCPG